MKKKTYLTLFFNFISRGVALHCYLGPCVQLQFLETLGAKLENRR